MIGSSTIKWLGLTAGSFLSAFLFGHFFPGLDENPFLTLWAIPIGWLLKPSKGISSFILSTAFYLIFNSAHESAKDLAVETIEALLVFIGVSWIRHLDQKLRKSQTANDQMEETAYNMFAATPVGFSIINEQGVFEFVNPAFCQIYDYKASELIGKSFELLAPMDKKEEYRKFHEQVIAGLKELTGEWTVIKKGGVPISVLSRVVRINGRDGRPKRVSFIIDISDRKKAEDRMAYLATFPEQNPDPVIEFSQSGDVLYRNSSAQRYFPDLGDKIAGHPFLANLEPILFILKNYTQKSVTREVKIDSRYFLQTFTLVKTSTNIRTYSHDITDFRRTQDEMRKLSVAIQQTSNAVIITDIRGNIEFVNSSFERITGYTKEEALGKNPRILKSGLYSRSHYERMWEILASGQSWFGEFHNRKKDGTLYWGEAHITPLKDAEGRIINYLGIQEDVTDRKNMLEALKQSREEAERANKLKSEFLATVSHEIRTPMNAIIGFSTLLSEEETDAEKQEKLRIINLSAQKLLDLINDILDFSKIEAGKIRLDLSEFDVSSMIDSLHRLFSLKVKEKSLTLEVKKSPYFPQKIQGDERKVFQVLQNLLSNAVKFTDQGSIVVDCSRENNFVRIEVRDSGIGIPGEKMEKIFFPFEQADVSTTRKYGGSGLGLAISRNYARLMGGDLNVTSSAGVGSTFIFQFPLNPKDEIPAPAARKPVFETPVVRILTAESDEHSCLVLRGLLEAALLRCDCARSGQEALRMLRDEKYDILFLDTLIPLLDGIAVIDFIRNEAEWKDLVVIALTTGDAHEMAFDDYLAKPLDPEAFNAVLQRTLGRIAKLRQERLRDRRLSSENIITVLKENYAIFRPGRIIDLADSIETTYTDRYHLDLAADLKTAAAQFDTEKLRSIIAGLEKGNNG